MLPQASSSGMSTHSVPCAEQRWQLALQLPAQQTRFPSTLARHAPWPQSASDSHACPAERRQASSSVLQPSSAQSLSVCHTPATQRWCREPEQRRSSSAQGAAGTQLEPSAAHTSFSAQACAQQMLLPSAVATQLEPSHAPDLEQGSPSRNRQPLSSQRQAAPSRAAGFHAGEQSARVMQPASGPALAARFEYVRQASSAGHPAGRHWGAAGCGLAEATPTFRSSTLQVLSDTPAISASPQHDAAMPPREMRCLSRAHIARQYRWLLAVAMPAPPGDRPCGIPRATEATKSGSVPLSSTMMPDRHGGAHRGQFFEVSRETSAGAALHGWFPWKPSGRRA
jgi:hypothetical protein